MSNTKNTTTTTTATAAAEAKIIEAEVKHAAVLAETNTAEENVNKAQAELKRIERCIADDDPSAGLEDLTKADTELRFFKLQLQAKTRAAVRAGGAVRTARTALILARLEAGEYGIAMDRLPPEAEALAAKIAALVTEHVALCEAHSEGRRRLLADAKESDAVNDQGTGNPASSLAYGHEGQKGHNPIWIEVDGEAVPEVYEKGRWEAILNRAKGTMQLGNESAEEIYPIY